MVLINKKLLKYVIFGGKGSPHACYVLYTQTVKLAFSHCNLEAERVSPYQKIEKLEDLSNANSKFSNTSAGIVFFAKAQGKQSSMHGYRHKIRSPHLFTLGKKRHNSSWWADMSPNRREFRQSHNRNDPSKYDLNCTPPILPA